eukprot:Sdes_comp19558_c0_seq1m11209
MCTEPSCTVGFSCIRQTQNLPKENSEFYTRSVLHKFFCSKFNSSTSSLLYLNQGFPMAYLVEKAGGKATTGLSRILDIQPEHIHDRSAVFLGSSEDVTDVEELYKKHNLGFQKSTENGVKSFP